MTIYKSKILQSLSIDFRNNKIRDIGSKKLLDSLS